MTSFTKIREEYVCLPPESTRNDKSLFKSKRILSARCLPKSISPFTPVRVLKASTWKNKKKLELYRSYAGLHSLAIIINRHDFWHFSFMRPESSSEKGAKGWCAREIRLISNANFFLWQRRLFSFLLRLRIAKVTAMGREMLKAFMNIS